ncbi:alpha/beta hydrolase [Vacuolonema iberomarrocanum]|uniref:alpha/beta hydrolase n=1 Tax=Vacuolonema iberomarrocanum TaxID=3454632 RepID=UPI0019ECB418|nr:alpha/beta fold hydrolase [filamentous cyanobacterium LEGE 07170]
MKWILMGLAIAAAVYGGMSALLYMRQTRLIFFPDEALESTPADVGVDFEEVWIEIPVVDGVERVHGWWMPASGTPQGERGALLYLHGNGANIGANVNHAARFHQMGLSVLLVDYRGYGMSDGAFPQEATVYQDAQASWDFLVNELGYAPEQVFIYGHSLGGAIAIDLAVRQPDAAGLIVQSSFTSILDMTHRTTPFGWLPVDQLLTQRFDSIAKVPQLQMPVFFMHGLEDGQVPADMSETLYTASPDPKQLWLVPDAGHNDLARVTGPEFFIQVEAFLASVQPLQTR